MTVVVLHHQCHSNNLKQLLLKTKIHHQNKHDSPSRWCEVKLKHPVFVCAPGAAAEGSDGSGDHGPHGGSGPRPPAAAAEQGLAAAPGPAGPAAERAGGPVPEKKPNGGRASAGAPS